MINGKILICLSGKIMSQRGSRANKKINSEGRLKKHGSEQPLGLL